MSIGTAVILVVLAALAVGGFVLARGFFTWRQKRLVTCPENERPAAVRVDAVRAVEGILTGDVVLRLTECSRWPEKQGCGQECLREIEKGPFGCLVRTVVANWYEGKTCVSCGKPIRDVSWADQRPGLRAPDGRLAHWPDIPPETLPDVFRTHAPVCWSCTVLQKVVQEHPEVVTTRPPRQQLYS